MNNKQKGETTPEKQKKTGFYAALYSCVGIMLILAAVIGYSNMTSDRNTDNNQNANRGEANSNNDQNFAAVDAREEQANSFIMPDSDNEQAKKKLREETPTAVPPPAIPSVAPAPASAPPVPAVEDSSPSSEDEVSQAVPDGFMTNEGTIIVGGPMVEGGILYPVYDPDNPRGYGDPMAAVENSEEVLPQMQTFADFNESDKMDWPLIGEIVMDYSNDHVIYDKTLDQYRTNETMCLSAELGAPVNSAAAGIVVEIYSTKENGKTVVIDHGNGWRTTYSQLSDELSVRVGDVVEAGEQVAMVGEPSIYSSLLGSHLGFTVTKDDVAVDPIEILGAEQ